MEDIHNMKFICIREGDCALPLSYVKSFIFGNRLISMPFADYGGPSSKNVNKKDMDLILKRTKKIANNLNVDFVEIRSPNDSYIPFFEENGFEKRDDYVTFKINLEKNKKELWLDMESERRECKPIKLKKKKSVFYKKDSASSFGDRSWSTG